MKKVLIIGGGIGGATAALALQKIGVEALLFERAPELKEVGAGIALWNAPYRVLERLGTGEKIRQFSTPLRFGLFGSAAGKVFRRMDLEKILGSEYRENFIIHRADLHSAILSGIAEYAIHTAYECEKVEQNSDGVKVTFKNGKTAEGDVLIGADGFHSIVRKTLFGESRARYSGQTCYRGVADIAALQPQVLAEIHGTGEKAKVKIKLRDGREIKGWIAELNADDFVVADSKTKNRTTIAYTDAVKVKNGGLSLAAKIGIGAIVVGAVAVIVIAAGVKNLDDNIFPN